VCVKECPMEVTNADIVSSKTLDCMTNDDVTECPGYTYNTITKFSYCLPKVDSDDAKAVVDEVYKQMNESLGLGQYMNDI
jgi:hypothetical protein